MPVMSDCAGEEKDGDEIEEKSCEWSLIIKSRGTVTEI